jgi:hypothetical protein
VLGVGRPVDYSVPRLPPGDELRWELELGFPLGSSEPTDPDDLREAWELYGEQLIAERDARLHAGRRPWAFWEFTAGRPARMLPDPSYTGLPVEVFAAAVDECAVEPILFLAEHGYLTDVERAELLRRGREARERIGTGGRLGESRSTDSGEYVYIGGDRSDVAIADALEEAG